jgi:hypothetical protein
MNERTAFILSVTIDPMDRLFIGSASLKLLLLNDSANLECLARTLTGHSIKSEQNIAIEDRLTQNDVILLRSLHIRI